MARFGAVALLATALAACSGGDEGSTEEFCAAVRDPSAFASVFEGFDPTDVDGALEQLRSARVQLGELRDAAPSELDDALDVEIDGIQQLIEALEGVEPGNSTAAVDAVRALEDDLAAVGEAATSLEAWVADRC